MPPKQLSDAAFTALSLYRSILKTHTLKLPPPMKQLGDRVVREEFKAHLIPGKANDEQWKTFLAEWTRYRDMLSGTADLNLSGNSNTTTTSSMPLNTDTTSASGKNIAASKKQPSPTTAEELRPTELGDTNILVTGIDTAGNLTPEVIQALNPEQKMRLEQLKVQAVSFGFNALGGDDDDGTSNNNGDSGDDKEKK